MRAMFVAPGSVGSGCDLTCGGQGQVSWTRGGARAGLGRAGRRSWCAHVAEAGIGRDGHVTVKGPCPSQLDQ